MAFLDERTIRTKPFKRRTNTIAHQLMHKPGHGLKIAAQTKPKKKKKKPVKKGY